MRAPRRTAPVRDLTTTQSRKRGGSEQMHAANSYNDIRHKSVGASMTDAPAISDLISISPSVRQSIRTLVIDDERIMRDSCASVLTAEGYHVTTAGRGAEALELLQNRAFDIVLIDLFMSDVPGKELLRVALGTHHDTVAIVITGKPSVESSLEVLRAGASDYLPKPFTGTQLQIMVGRAAHAVIMARENRARESAGRPGTNSDRVLLLGNAPTFRAAIDQARKVAPTNASVFITGESGAGKELIAQFIHAHSHRHTRPLVAVNCAALPEPLLESEMFGHVKGAFTGAIRDKAGLLETANGGTMFLDELIEMATPIQAKLLRVIQDGVVRRVGSETTDAVINARFIAATNRDPDEAVRSGALRKDLYYRLRVVPIHVPPLRERPDDIPLLASYFLEHSWRAHRGKERVPTLTKAAIWALRAYPWPGNVRELQNVIEHAAVLLEPGASIRPEDIPFIGDAGAEPEPEVAADQALANGGYYTAREHLLSKFDRRFLTKVVIRAGGNLSKAARLAHIDRTSFYRLMERHGLRRDSLANTADD